MKKIEIATRMVEIVTNEEGKSLPTYPVIVWYVHSLKGDIRKPSTVSAEYSKAELEEALEAFEQELALLVNEEATQEVAEVTEKAEAIQPLVVGQEVFVYWNLHKNCFSVKDVKSGLVVAHRDSIQLTNATFKVSEAGRQRVLRERVKNVHAGVRGFVTFRLRSCNAQAIYDPYKYETFVDKTWTDEPIHRAGYVDMINKKVYYKG